MSDRPEQAVILAGGRGERLRPLSDLRPKPMIEVAGKPFLEHLLLELKRRGSHPRADLDWLHGRCDRGVFWQRRAARDDNLLSPLTG